MKYLGKSSFNQNIEPLLATKKSIVLASPRDPDADSCMSILAFREFLDWLGKKHGKEFQVVCFAPNLPEPNSLFDTVRALGDPREVIQTSLPFSNQ